MKSMSRDVEERFAVYGFRYTVCGMRSGVANFLPEAMYRNPVSVIKFKNE